MTEIVEDGTDAWQKKVGGIVVGDPYFPIAQDGVPAPRATPADEPLLPWWAALGLVLGLAALGSRFARKPASALFFLMLALSVPAQTVLEPAPFLMPEWGQPDYLGISVTDYDPLSVPSYGIDLDHDGVLDFTLTAIEYDILAAFEIIPAGTNAVLSVDGTYVANLPAGAVLSAQGSSVGGSWQESVNYITAFGEGEPDTGQFLWTNGFIGLRFTSGGKVHYGFLQINCADYIVGGFYQGCGWNQTPGASVTTTNVAVLAPPSLEMHLFQDYYHQKLLFFFWPITSSNYVLQASSAVDRGWATMTNTVFTTGGWPVPFTNVVVFNLYNTVFGMATNSQRFYRLLKTGP
jgi:hypothetical protein